MISEKDSPLSPNSAEQFEALLSCWDEDPALTAMVLSDHRWSTARHLDLLAEWLLDVAYGRRKRVIVTMPPRHGKSEFISRWFPVWFLNKWPWKRIILASYEAEFAASWGRKVRNSITQNGSRLRVAVRGGSSAADYWETTKDGGMTTAGVGGPITGKGADLLIIDDPVKNWQEANSPTIRERTWDWWQSTAYTRLEPHGAAIVVMTRWHEEDLAGRLLAATGEQWDLLNLPALSESGDALGREIGEPLWPERFGMSELLAKRGSMDEFVWIPLYQQRPSGAAGLGACYHAFSEANMKLIEYDPSLPLCWALDFNVDPMCSVIAQVEDKATRLDMLTGTRKQNINVLDEICLVDSTTEKACAEFMRRTERWANYRRLVVEVYADASGYSRKTSGKTDIEIIRQAFQHDGRYHLEFRTTKSNPHVRDRVNAVNAALCNSQQERSLFIDPQCKQLRRDLQTVKWKRDISGNATNDLDKSNPMLTHVSDAAGYLIEKVAGMRQQGGFVGGYQQAGGFIA